MERELLPFPLNWVVREGFRFLVGNSTSLLFSGYFFFSGKVDCDHFLVVFC